MAFVTSFALPLRTPSPHSASACNHIGARATSLNGLHVPHSRRPLSPKSLSHRRAVPIATAANTSTPSSSSSSSSSTTEDRGEWEGVVSIVRDLVPELDEAKADKLVGRAFGWGTQKFWRGRVKRQPASIATVTAACAFLRDTVGLTDSHLAKIVPKFPEVLAIPISRMSENVAHITRTYPNLKDALLTNAVADNPAVLGYDFDCEGDCKSECARCWVQF